MFIELCAEDPTLYIQLWSSFSGTFSVTVETEKKSWTRRKLTTLLENPYNDLPLLAGK